MNSDVIELLIAKGADVNAKDNNWNTPLYAAIYPESEAQYHLVEVLITNGADVNTRNNKGETPLQAMDNWNTKGRPLLMSLIVTRLTRIAKSPRKKPWHSCKHR